MSVEEPTDSDEHGGLPSAFGSFAPPCEDDLVPFSESDAERYVDGGLLGQGGMGRVWSCWDNRLKRTVARKEVRPGTHAAARLAREAWVTANLEHPAIVTVLDAGVSDGVPWYTMPLVRGRSLSALIEETEHLKERLALIRYFHVATEAMAYAHQNGVLHRDLKPENILVGSFGDTLVVDWGLARHIDGEHDSSGSTTHTDASLTRLGSIIGTPAYMSPEQARGERADARSDVWSLGMVLGEILRGYPVFTEDASDVVGRVGRAEIPPIEHGPIELRAVVERCTAADANARYPDAAALSADILAWLEGRVVGAHDYTSTELIRRLAWAWRWPLGLMGSVVALAVGATAVGGVLLTEQRNRALQAEQRAVSSEKAARHSLAEALLASAVPALRSLDQPTAERIAWRAREAAPDDPELLARANGVIAGFPPTRPRAVTSVTCSDASATLSGDLVCMVDQGGQRDVVRRARARGFAEAWRVPIERSPYFGVRAVGEYTLVMSRGSLILDSAGRVVHKLRSSGVRGAAHRAVVWRGRDAMVSVPALDEIPKPCDIVSNVAGTGDDVAILCGDGTLWVGGEVFSLGIDRGALGMDYDGRSVVIVTTGGEAWFVDLATGEVHSRNLPFDAPDRALLAEGWIGIDGSVEGPLLLNGAGDPVHRLPKSERLIWLADGEALTASEDRVTLWRFDTRQRLEVETPGGLSGLVDDGRALWGADGSGHVMRWEPPHDPALRKFAGDVIKPPFPTADGTWVLDLTKGAPLRRLGDELQTLETMPKRSGLKSIAVTDTSRYGITFGGSLWRLGSDAQRLFEGCTKVTVHKSALMAACASGLVTLGDGDDPVVVDPNPVDRLASSGDGLVRAFDRTVRWGDVELEFPLRITALGASEERVAVGFIDGSVRVWDVDGTLQHVLAGHTERVSGIVLRGDRLWTAGWDTHIRAWWLDGRDETAHSVSEAWTPPLPDERSGTDGGTAATR